MKAQKTGLIIVFIFSYCFSCYSFTIETLGLESGLSNSYITSITQDKEGFLWVATESGLNRFDGSRFTAFKKKRSQLHVSISSNELNRVYADKYRKIIWIATQREGLNAFDYEKGIFKHYTHEIKNRESLVTNDVTDVVNASDGNIWISTYSQGIEYFNPETNIFTHYNRHTLPMLPDNRVWTVRDDGMNTLYVGHVSNGLSIISLKDMTVKNFVNDPNDPQSIPGNIVRSIYIDNERNIWIGTNKGLALYDPKKDTFRNFKNDLQNQSSLVSDYVHSITQLKDGRIFIGTENGGVSILDSKNNYLLEGISKIKFENIVSGNDGSNLSNPTVRTIYQDSFSNIWIGTYGGGLNFISSTKPFFSVWQYAPVHLAESLSNRIAWGICVDMDNNVWVGTDGGGLNVFENGVNRHIMMREQGGLTDNAILAAMKDYDGNLWFGTFRGGVSFFDWKEKRFIRMLPQLKGYDVRAFFEDRNNVIWIATNKGLYSYKVKSKSLNYYNAENSPISDYLVRTISQDKEGNLWVGTFGQGIIVVDKNMKLIKHFTTESGLYSNMVEHLYCDTKKRMWVATGEGLVLFRDTRELSTFEIFTSELGLTDDQVKAITEDQYHNLWISSNNGLNRFDPDKKELLNYTHSAGVPLGIFLSGSVAKSSDGTIYFGSQNGVCFFNPKDIQTQIELAPIAFNSFVLYDKNSEYSNVYSLISGGKGLGLSYKENTFKISFNTLNYAQNKMTEYAYMLDGFDDKWIGLHNENTVTFRNIPPGNYILKVKAQLRNQSQKAQVISLPIIIYPPFWATWWARLIYIIMIGLVIVCVFNFYKRKLSLENCLLLETEKRFQEQTLNNERLQFYTNVTHELRTPLTLIMGPLDDLRKDKSLPEKYKSRISIIYRSAVHFLNLINQILEFRKTETSNKNLRVRKADLGKLVKEVVFKYVELNINKDLLIDVVIETPKTNIYLDQDIITTILDNLISNAIKHTEKGSVIVSLRNICTDNNEYSEIEVTDTGNGIDKKDLPYIFDRYYQGKNNEHVSGTGIGLALVNTLVKIHQGTITVESEHGKGTSFFFRIQTNNSYPESVHVTSEEQSIMEMIDKSINAPEVKKGTKPIVLILEDNKDICMYIKESLSDYYEVISADNGEKGLELAYNITPDIILSDIMMPIMDGIEFCKKIKKDVRTSHIPVILITAKDAVHDRVEGYNVGADSYIVKPFNSGLLHSRITNLLESRQNMAQLVDSSVMAKGLALSNSISKLDSEFLEKVSEVIGEHLEDEKIDVLFIAEKMNMSHSSFYRKIKALTGKTANEYIRKIKMKNAERLLLVGKYSISEVSFMLGFNSQTYFRQCFKDEFGLPPSEYLKFIASNSSKE